LFKPKSVFDFPLCTSVTSVVGPYASGSVLQDLIREDQHNPRHPRSIRFRSIV
jgi:hypothetical protein